MKKVLLIAVASWWAAGLAQAAVAADAVPRWAFLFPDQNRPVEPARNGVYTLPGSKQSYTQAQIDDHKKPPDWFPDAHPPFPRAVRQGGEGMALACAACHLASGMGHPESGSLAGYPTSYFMRQMAEFKSGARTNHAIPDAQPMTDLVLYMVEIAKSWSEQDEREAAEFFASLKPIPGWVKVVETSTVPKSYVNATYARVPWPGNATEPLGERIIELPKDLELMQRRDPKIGTIAYVPIGALARGKALASKGAMSCATCHGPKLTGAGDVPSIAGRSPLYAFKQLYMFKEGSRNGAMAGLMKPQVASLSQSDMIDLAAYLASLTP
jgi:cytochrome c553